MINSENLNPSALRRMLEEIGKLAEDSSLTGNGQGRERLVKHYNAVLQGLQAQGADGSEMFLPLDEKESDFGTIAVESQMLLAATGGSNKEKRKHERSKDVDWLCGIAPFLNGVDLEHLIEEKLDEKISFPDDMLPAIAPFVSRDFLGKIVRKRFATKVDEPKAEEEKSEASIVFGWGSKPVEKVVPESADEVAEIVSRMRTGLNPADRDRLQETLSRVLRELESK